MLRIGDSGTEVTIRSFCCRNCCGAGSNSAFEGVAISTDCSGMIDGVDACSDCVIPIEGCAMVCSGAKPLGARYLVSSAGAKAWGFGFPLLPMSERTCLESFALLVPTSTLLVPEGPTTSAMEKAGTLNTHGVC